MLSTTTLPRRRPGRGSRRRAWCRRRRARRRARPAASTVMLPSPATYRVEPSVEPEVAAAGQRERREHRAAAAAVRRLARVTGDPRRRLGSVDVGGPRTGGDVRSDSTDRRRFRVMGADPSPLRRPWPWRRACAADEVGRRLGVGDGRRGGRRRR